MTSITSITASDMLTTIAPYGPAVEGGELVFDRDLPDDLATLVSVMHTGIRALLTRRTWWGSTSADGQRPRVVQLRPDVPVPPRIWLLCADGDSCWDRVHPAARIDHPRLFQ